MQAADDVAVRRARLLDAARSAVPVHPVGGLQADAAIVLAEGSVLLKNEQQILPLQREQLSSIAMIGPDVQVAQIMGGGSAQVNAHYAVTPFQGIVAKVGDRVRVGYEQGCTNYKWLPLLDSDLLLAGTEGSEHGLAVEYFTNLDLAGPPIWQETQPKSELSWFGEMPAGVNPQQFSVRVTGRLTPRETGSYTFGLISIGRSRLSIDGQQVIENWTEQTRGGDFLGMGGTEIRKTVTLEAGRTYLLTLEFTKSEALPLGALHLGCLPPVSTDTIERAVHLAAASDVAIVCVGFGGDWQSEGFDRRDMALPGKQDELIEQVAAANPRTIVVLNTGSPITMPWLDKVAAVVQAWYPGQECGNAMADVLFGDTNPSGKLPQTFPVRLEDNPAYLNFPGENGKVYYGEGLFVGYRYYDKKKIAPQFPFGFGLSYTTFDYSSLSLSSQQLGPDDTLQVSIDITNTGQRAGKEIVQGYVRDPQAHLQRPEKELKAFAKVQLEPGERKTVTLSIARDALAYFDDLAGLWVAEAGEFELLVGASAQDIRATATFTLTATTRWPS